MEQGAAPAEEGRGRTGTSAGKSARAGQEPIPAAPCCAQGPGDWARKRYPRLPAGQISSAWRGERGGLRDRLRGRTEPPHCSLPPVRNPLIPTLVRAPANRWPRARFVLASHWPAGAWGRGRHARARSPSRPLQSRSAAAAPGLARATTAAAAARLLPVRGGSSRCGETRERRGRARLGAARR